MNINTLSDANGTLGVTPDPLIPTIDPYFKEPRNAFPVTVPANQVQSAWIDVLVPTSAPSGYYSATVTVLDGTTVVATLSVVLKVWAFTLPSTATLKSAFNISWNGLCVQAYGSYANCANYPGSGGNSDTALELMHVAEATLLLDHRVTASTAIYVGPPSITWSHFSSTYGPLMNGTAGTLLSGAKLTNLQYLPPAANNMDPATIQDWVTNFTANGWLGQLFHYTCDEPPNGCSWADALTMEQTVYNASSQMKTLITTDMASATQYDLLPDLSIIVPTVDHLEPQGGTNQRSSYDPFLAGTNKHIWWYQACTEHGSCTNGYVGPATATWPSYMVDATPVRNRVFQWLAFIDRIEAELYYQIDWCWVYVLCGPNNNSSAPWTSVYAFGGNGDGTLIYPGTPAIIGGTTPIALPSVRLKHIRDGMEDFEYLIALSKAGDDAFARSIAATIITNAYTFDNDPQALMNSREALGDRLHQLNSFTLSVSVTGGGTVTSSPAGINCRSTCTASFGRGAQVTLTASPDSGSSFAGWNPMSVTGMGPSTGAWRAAGASRWNVLPGNSLMRNASAAQCNGIGTCVVTMNSDLNVTASFAAGISGSFTPAMGTAPALH